MKRQSVFEPQFLPVGTRVQWSEYHLRRSRDYYLGLGREPAKSRAKDEYDRQRAMRGTITEILRADPRQWNGPGNGYRVTFDDGSKHQCITCMVEQAKD